MKLVYTSRPDAAVKVGDQVLVDGHIFIVQEIERPRAAHSEGKVWVASHHDPDGVVIGFTPATCGMTWSRA